MLEPASYSNKQSLMPNFRELAELAARANNAAPSLSNARPPAINDTEMSPPLDQLEKREEVKATKSSTSSLSSFLGLWAWDQGKTKEASRTTASKPSNETQKPL